MKLDEVRWILDLQLPPVVETLGFSSMLAYQIWKVSCELVINKGIPETKRMLMEEVEELRKSEGLVEARDRGMFEV